MLKQLKDTTLKISAATKFTAALGASRWRNKRLLILCYHGISMSDEHLWNPELYMSAQQFESRLLALRRASCTVLPLSIGIDALYRGALPPKAVCLTFDDGFYDFFSTAAPILRKHEMPATVYVTSFYSKFQRPVFDVMLSYLLWRGRDKEFRLDAIGGHGTARLRTRADMDEVASQTRLHAATFSAERKDRLLQSIAEALDIDYATILSQRTLHLMNSNELAALGNSFQIELHTHRHRVPMDEALFVREVSENRRYIFDTSAGRCVGRHFCYPSGVVDAAFFPRLRALGVRSATTCKRGLASRSNEPLALPRLLDSSNVTEVEFEAWLSGIAALLPRPQVESSAPTSDGILTRRFREARNAA